MSTVIGWGCAWCVHAVVGEGWAVTEIFNLLLDPKSRFAVCEYCITLAFCFAYIFVFLMSFSFTIV